MKRWLLIGWLVVALVLAGCGGLGKDKNSDDEGSGVPTLDAPRNRTLPEGEPFAFEAPFSVGKYLRESMDGRSTATQAGGLQATYAADGQIILLTAYRFTSPQQAVETVRFALESPGFVEMVEPPYYSPAIAYGVALDRHGGHTGIWSHDRWMFKAYTTHGLDTLKNFMELFPY